MLSIITNSFKLKQNEISLLIVVISNDFKLLLIIFYKQQLVVVTNDSLLAASSITIFFNIYIISNAIFFIKHLNHTSISHYILSKICFIFN
jgi:hypothetical protein